MYKPIRSAELVEGGNIIKQGEHFTLTFQLFDEDGATVDVNGKTVAVKIANQSGVIFETTATPESEGRITFSVNENIGHGTMRVELAVTEGETLVQKYPADGWIELKLTPSLDDLEFAGVNTVTVSELRNELSKMQKDYKTVVDDSLDSMQTQINQIVTEGDSSLEAAQARVSADDTVYATLKERLDTENTELKSLIGNVSVTVEDASLNTKGIVQLSNATDSTSEILAATPKAVKAAYDLAKSKQDVLPLSQQTRIFVQSTPPTNPQDYAICIWIEV